MLVIAVTPGEATTITTPAGETISVVLLQNRYLSQKPRLGITAPESYVILRASLRERLLAELQHVPVFEISSDGAPTCVIAADDRNSAIACYQRTYPKSDAIVACRLRNVQRYCWYPELETLWLQGEELPFFVDSALGTSQI